MEITFDNVFYWCVEILVVAAKALNMTYEEINVWIFCIIEPIIFILMCIWLIYLIFRVSKLKAKLKEAKFVAEN